MMRRISVVGTSGSGKTTVARALAARLGLVHIELDGIYHQPDWQPLEREAFRRRLRERMAAAPRGWAICGNHRASVGDLVLAAADTLVWLDLPRSVTMWQVTWRTLRRVARREVLWNGNREPFSNLYAWDPEANIIRWAWVKHPEVKRQYEALLSDPPRGLRTVRLRSRREVADFLAAAR